MLTSWYGGLQEQAAAWAAIQHQSGAVPLVEEGKHAPVGCKTPAQILPARKGVHGLIAHHLLAMNTRLRRMWDAYMQGCKQGLCL